MIDITDKGKVKIHWKVSPYDYSSDKVKEIEVAFAKKYGIPRDNVRVTVDFVTINQEGESNLITEGVIDNINDPKFLKKLFKDYLELNGIKNYDFELIESIDRDINSRIDFESFDKYRRFSIKWVKWSNFQSYGADNSFDFSNLHGLVLLNGEPANQSGKTTFAVDLLHFLLFGKSGKYERQEQLFNYCLPEATSLSVEGCITVDGEDYVIKRSLNRPALDKRTAKSKTTQKVEYYRVVGDSMEVLDDYVESVQGEDSRSTNKIIKESIGREDDFDLMMCITGSNLDTLIDEKPTEKGRLFSRWIGLLPLEEKDAVAREKYNQTVKPSLLLNQYNRETLKQEIEAYDVEIESVGNKIKELNKEIKAQEKKITSLEEDKNKYIQDKQQIDNDVLKIDISTVNRSLENKKDEGVKKTAQLNETKKKINEIGEVDFSVEEYDNLNEAKTKLLLEQQEKRNDAKRLIQQIKQLEKGEYCPTCGRKLDNVDNSKQIAELKSSLETLIEKGKEVTAKLEECEKKISSMKEKREKYTQLNSLKTQVPALELNIEKLRNECLELINKQKEYKKNSDAIDKNNQLDIKIRNTEAEIRALRQSRETNLKTVTNGNANVEEYKKEISKRKDIISKIEKEEILVYNWKLYLEMVGKNGISKMVIRKALPIINARMIQLLDGVCDFDVRVDINNRNEIQFNIVKNGIVESLSSGSGFEKTAAALALRCVLADMSTISRMNFLVLDEVLGRVASSNYESMNVLYDRIEKGYDFIFHITHIDTVKDWHSHIVTVTKTKDGISYLKQTDNTKKPSVKKEKEVEKKTTTKRKTNKTKKSDD